VVDAAFDVLKNAYFWRCTRVERWNINEEQGTMKGMLPV
jgi:hypothetical protein